MYIYLVQNEGKTIQALASATLATTYLEKSQNPLLTIRRMEVMEEVVIESLNFVHFTYENSRNGDQSFTFTTSKGSSDDYDGNPVSMEVSKSPDGVDVRGKAVFHWKIEGRFVENCEVEDGDELYARGLCDLIFEQISLMEMWGKNPDRIDEMLDTLFRATGVAKTC